MVTVRTSFGSKTTRMGGRTPERLAKDGEIAEPAHLNSIAGTVHEAPSPYRCTGLELRVKTHCKNRNRPTIGIVSGIGNELIIES